MKNPVYQVFEKKKPFIFFHTHVITRDVLDAVIAAKGNLEIDLSVDENESVYVGHPPLFYEYFKLPSPSNLPLETILKEAKAAGIYLVLDCKDVRALPTVQKTIEDYGAENCLLHAAVDALNFKPYPPEVPEEPSWKGEVLPLDKVLEVKWATRVPLALFSLGFSLSRFKKEGESLIDRVIEVAEGNAEVVVLRMPKGEPRPKWAMEKLLQHNLLPLFNIDHTPPEARPPLYVGTTDQIELATKTVEFS